MLKRICVLCFSAVLALGMGTIPVAADDPFTIVVGGLQSPRGLSFGPGGKLYVAQAGSGDSTGKITEVSNAWTPSPSSRNVLTGLISAGDEGEFLGIDGVSVHGNGGIYAIFALSNVATGFPSKLGHLFKVTPSGISRDIANVGDFNYAWSQDHVDLAPRDFPDSNPYAVLALPDRVYVADAGTNTLNLISPDGSDQILAYFPNNTIADSTPTCIAKGPDGALYVGTLALVDSIVFGPSAIIYRVDPTETDPNDLSTVLNVATPWARGFWPINGCAFGPDGSLYVSELITKSDFSPSGEVVKISFDNPSIRENLTGAALAYPAGVAVGPDSNVYVSNGGAFVPEGQVVRLTKH
jgi:hypothetical protein